MNVKTGFLLVNKATNSNPLFQAFAQSSCQPGVTLLKLFLFPGLYIGRIGIKLNLGFNLERSGIFISLPSF
jgi:hypothetical protein